MKRCALVLFLLVFATLACAIPGILPSPVATIVVKPIDSAQADAKLLEQASQIITKRLDYAGIRGLVLVKDGETISVAIYSAADLDAAQKLATETGDLVFTDATESYPAGYTFETISNVILTKKDIQTAVVQKSVISDVELGTFEIALSLTLEGKKKMAAYSTDNVGHTLLIIKDNVLLLAPTIASPITGGEVIITGLDQITANTVAAQMRIENLPFRLQVEEIKQGTPTK